MGADHISGVIHRSQDTSHTGPIGTTGFNKLNQLDQLEEPKVKLTKQEVLGCDIGLSQFADLIPPAFRKWHCKVWYQIGRERYAELAAQARADGKHPARLMSHLLKKELQNQNSKPQTQEVLSGDVRTV